MEMPRGPILTALVAAVFCVSGCSDGGATTDRRSETATTGAHSPVPTVEKVEAGKDVDAASSAEDEATQTGSSGDRVREDLLAKPREAWTYQPNLPDGVFDPSLKAVDAGHNRLAVLSRGWLADGGMGGTLSVVDSISGARLWAVDLAEFGAASAEDVMVNGISAEGHLLLALVIPRQSTWAHLYSLDPTNGVVVSQTILGGEACSTATGCLGDAHAVQRVPGWPLLVSSGDLVARYDTGDLSGEPQWTVRADSGDAYITGVRNDYVSVQTTEGGSQREVWLDAETGFLPAWFNGADPEARYQIVESVVLRVLPSPSFSAIEAIDLDGTPLWSTMSERMQVDAGAMGDVLYVYQHVEDDPTLQSSQNLMRLDPRTGEDVWSQAHRGPFLRAHTGGSVVLHGVDGRSSTVLDLTTGQVMSQLSAVVTHIGTRTALDHDSEQELLREWDLTEGAELWSIPTGGRRPDVIGSGLYLVDQENSAISRLRP